MDSEVIEKIMMRKEFSEIPLKDVERALSFFPSDRFGDEERVKKTRDLLRRVYSGFGGRKLLLWKDKSAEEVLEKHLSTRERFLHYEEIYSRLLKGVDKKKISVIDLGAGVNGFSYDYFSKVGFKKVNYLGVEAVGQLVDLMNGYFKNQGLKSARAVHESLFSTSKIIDLISEMESPRVIFMFKVVDSLEKLERNYTLRFLEALKEIDFEKIVISFATESWHRRKKFYVQRTWLINFIRENFSFMDDFTLGGERYVVFGKK
tara:strand:+ start:27176 stop:27958 length:783 start_codon:yes stop_codon:yes gene_type:complete